MKLITKWRRKVALRKRRKELTGKRDEVWKAFERDIEVAKTGDEKHWLGWSQLQECAEFDDELLAIESAEVLRRAAPLHLSLSDIPLTEGETSHWETGNYGARYIQPKTLRLFTKMVEAAEYERVKRRNELNDFWLKIFTAVFAAAAAVASVLNLIGSHTQKR